MLSTPPEYWHVRGEGDMLRKDLVDPDTGDTVSYDELLQRRNGKPYEVDREKFKEQWANCQRSIEELSKTLRQVNPDVVVIVSDDQDEILFEDNMPMFSIYWGDDIRLIPRTAPDDAMADIKASTWGYGDKEMDVPVNSALGKHLIEYLTEAEFDVAHSRYLREDYMYGGSIGPASYIKNIRVTKPRRHGMGHGFSFVVKRIMDNNPFSIVPINQNTCYPPNSPTPRRCYRFGQAIRSAIEAWDSDARVAVMASGGLSHFVTDEVVDGMAIKGMMEKNGEILGSLPRERLLSAASEIKNWVTLSGATEHLTPEVVGYEAVYRSPAGTGGGWGFMRWT
jgi:3-O-methylgallate 3,4-dioxygenase